MLSVSNFFLSKSHILPKKGVTFSLFYIILTGELKGLLPLGANYVPVFFSAETCICPSMMKQKNGTRKSNIMILSLSIGNNFFLRKNKTDEEYIRSCKCILFINRLRDKFNL